MSELGPQDALMILSPGEFSYVLVHCDHCQSTTNPKPSLLFCFSYLYASDPLFHSAPTSSLFFHSSAPSSSIFSYPNAPIDL